MTNFAAITPAIFPIRLHGSESATTLGELAFDGALVFSTKFLGSGVGVPRMQYYVCLSEDLLQQWQVSRMDYNKLHLMKRRGTAKRAGQSMA